MDSRWHCRYRLVVLLGLAFVLAAGSTAPAIAFGLAPPGAGQAAAPPRETFHRLGTDAAGVDWQVHVAVGEPLVVFGARRWQVATREPFDLFEVHATIDAKDVVWIVDGRGRGVRVNLSDGRSEEFRVPVSRQLVGGIAVRQGLLYFGDNPATGDRTVRQLTLASGAVKTVLSLSGAWSLHSLVSGRRHVWLVNWTGLAGPEDTIELVALDWATGAPNARGRRSAPRAEYPQSRLEVVESDDGAAWVASGYAGRVDRMESTGAWQSWSLGGRTPSNLVTAEFGAACVLQRLEPLRDALYLEGLPLRQPTVLSREIAAFQPGTSRLETLPLDADVRLLPDRDGRVRVEGRGRLSLDGGPLKIVPDGALPVR